MKQSEMLELKKGDQVRYVGDDDFASWPTHGTIVTRVSCWLDDDGSVKFTWVNNNGDLDYHFFVPDELEFIKE